MLLLTYFFSIQCNQTESTIVDTAVVNKINPQAERLIRKSPKEAITMVRQALSHATDLNFELAKITAFKHIGTSKYVLEDYDSAFYSFTQSLDLTIRIKKEQQARKTLGMLALLYERQGEITKAEEHYLKALNIFNKTKSIKALAGTHNNLVFFYKHLGKRNEALYHYKTVLKWKKEHNNFIGIASPLTNLGGLYQRLSEYDLAMQHALESLKYLEHSSYQYRKGATYNLLEQLLSIKNG